MWVIIRDIFSASPNDDNSVVLSGTFMRMGKENLWINQNND